MASSTAFFSSFLFLFLLLTPSSANEGDILVSGNVLSTDEQLSIENAVFVIQNDCNLVLYNKGKGFQSNTSGLSTNCTLTLSDHGQLVITDVIKNKVVWSSSLVKGNSKGEYAAILQPDGEVGIYGPAVCSTPRLVASKAVSTAGATDKMFSDMPSVADKIFDAQPRAANLWFSSEVLREGSKVVSRDYTLEVTKECSLQLTKSAHDKTVVWKSTTVSGRENCFARLNHRGQLALLGDDNKVLWSTKEVEVKKEPYVLAMKIDGQATIYAPRFWSTAA